MSVIERVAELLTPVVSRCGADLYDVTFAGGVLVVLVAKPTGIGLDELVEVNRAVSAALDESDVLPGAYNLEVSSPGVERVLRTTAHFAGAVGDRVSVKTNTLVAGHRRFAGTLAIAAADHIVLAADDAGDIEIPLVAIERARTQFDWEPTPKPGKVPKAPASRGAGRAKRPVGGAAEGVEQNDEAGRIEPASDDRRVRGQADAVHSEIDQHETANGVRR